MAALLKSVILVGYNLLYLSLILSSQYDLNNVGRDEKH